MLVSANVSIDTTGATDAVTEMVNDSVDVSGFMIFVSLLAMLCEVALIAVRFLNFGVVNRFFFMFVALVSILHDTQ